jgi:GT2 family glycosyltransferase
MEDVRVTVVTVIYGNRWPLLKEVVSTMMRDPKVTTLIIVDNGSQDPMGMDNTIEEFGERIVLLRQEKNIGYSGAISKGLEYARNTHCDYVFVLDDDSVPEEGAIDYFLMNLKLFPDNKVVLAGNRVNVPGNPEIFYRPPLKTVEPRGTLFEVFSIRKIMNALRLLTGRYKKADSPFLPIVPMEAFVTGASFIPIEAVREAPLPDPSLFIYGEDLEYSWNVLRRGYRCYACSRPKIFDIDLTFSEQGDHIFGLFDSETPAYKVFFRIRNGVIISRRNTYQSSPVLFINVVTWLFGLALVGLMKKGLSQMYFKRLSLFIQAVWHGYFPSRSFPREVKLP